MTANNTENIKTKELSTSIQPSVMLFVVIVAGLLIALPLLPAWVHNLSYSFTGESPRIYWYLSRAAGLVALSILWLSMALGLSLTNKIARVWPGASTAFTLHEYVSLLGLTFAVYHGLVLMGDHFVDFSFLRLLVPFSIAYLPFWTGLGQLAFYVWLFVALSFYVRQRIGQKTWRKIHYLNFVTYVMGMSHGILSGWDSDMSWAKAYYWFSGLSLLGLLAYRIYITVAPKNSTRPQQTAQEAQTAQQVSIPASIPRASATQTQFAESDPAPAAISAHAEKPAPASVPVQTAIESTVKPVINEQELALTLKKALTEILETKSIDVQVLPRIIVKAPLSPAIPAQSGNEKSTTDQESHPALEELAVTKMISQIRKKMRLKDHASVWEKKIFNGGEDNDVFTSQQGENEKVSALENK